MSTTRLADRRIRAAAIQGAPRLDVRGPISKALARTGLEVPPADALIAEAPPVTALPVEASRPPADRPASRPAPGVRGLEARAPKPIPAPFRLPPVTTRDGLTADERRVHRVLVESLEREYDRREGGMGWMSYVEKQKLEALDLDYIEAELAEMRRTERLLGWGIKGGLAAGVVALPIIALILTQPGVGNAFDIVAGLLALLGGLGVFFVIRSGTSQRQAIYEALRELALAADPGEAPTAAVAEADRIIDQLAFSDLDDAGLEAPSDRAPAARRRARS